jgi:uncharacterized protein YndB with AHSA1/START domain
MVHAKPDSQQPTGAREDSCLPVQPRAESGGTITFQKKINAAPETVFELLTRAERMICWLARDVKTIPEPLGVFRLTDFSGQWVEGTYLRVVPTQIVAFTWGGIDGLRSGQSIVEITIRPQDNGTFVRLHHFGLSKAAVRMHTLFWRNWGLPKLQAAAEGRDPGVSCLSEVADWREQHSYSTSNSCES